MASLLPSEETLVGPVDRIELVNGQSSTLNRRSGLPLILSVKEDEIEMVVSIFGDRWVVLCSEVGKVGTVLECLKIDQTYSVQVSLGDREDVWTRLLGRQLMAASQQKLPILLMLGLKTLHLEEDAIQAKLRKVIDMFKELTRPVREQAAALKNASYAPPPAK